MTVPQGQPVPAPACRGCSLLRSLSSQRIPAGLHPTLASTVFIQLHTSAECPGDLGVNGEHLCGVCNSQGSIPSTAKNEKGGGRVELAVYTIILLGLG